MNSTDPLGNTPTHQHLPSAGKSKNSQAKGGREESPQKKKDLDETVRQKLPFHDLSQPAKPLARKVHQQDDIEIKLNPVKKISKAASSDAAESESSIEESSSSSSIPGAIREYMNCKIHTQGDMSQGTASFQMTGKLEDRPVFDINYNATGNQGKPKLEVKLYNYKPHSFDPDRVVKTTTSLQMGGLAIAPQEMWDKFDRRVVKDLLDVLDILLDNTFTEGPTEVYDNLIKVTEEINTYINLYK